MATHEATTGRPVAGRLAPWLLGLAALALAAGGLAGLAAWTAPVRESVRTYTDLLAAANRQDSDAARDLCTARYRASHRLEPSAEGGLVGLPRGIHKNFRAWLEGPHVWLCPTNRVGPVYQFVREGGAWRFDGPVGVLRPRGELIRLPDGAEPPGEGGLPDGGA